MADRPILKTDYKDWIPDQNGFQYLIGTTSAGNSSITDVTKYKQEGNDWKGEILNKTNTTVNILSQDLSVSEQQIVIIYRQVNEIRDPTTGLRSPIQVVVDNLYALHREGAITAQEYSDLGLTAAEYANKGLTAFEYNTRAKELLK